MDTGQDLTIGANKNKLAMKKKIRFTENDLKKAIRSGFTETIAEQHNKSVDEVLEIRKRYPYWPDLMPCDDYEIKTLN